MLRLSMSWHLWGLISLALVLVVGLVSNAWSSPQFVIWRAEQLANHDRMASALHLLIRHTAFLVPEPKEIPHGTFYDNFFGSLFQKSCLYVQAALRLVVASGGHETTIERLRSLHELYRHAEAQFIESRQAGHDDKYPSTQWVTLWAEILTLRERLMKSRDRRGAAGSS